MSVEFNANRRKFLKVGLAGSAVLAVVGGGVWLMRKPANCHDCKWLTQDDRTLLLTLVPVMLAGALPQAEDRRRQAVEEIILGFDTTVRHFSRPVRDEIRQLLSLIEFPATRALLAGVWSDWDRADTKAIEDFLTGWQHSRFDLLRVGYAALHDLITGAWYANPQSWQRIEYPGPKALV